MAMKYEDLKKGDKILTKQLGTPISGELLESPKQGKGLKKAILIYSNGEEIGMFSEAGSVYATDILKVNREGTWHNVTGQPDTEDQEKMLEALEARNGF